VLAPLARRGGAEVSTYVFHGTLGSTTLQYVLLPRPKSKVYTVPGDSFEFYVLDVLPRPLQKRAKCQDDRVAGVTRVAVLSIREERARGKGISAANRE
jgi:hypothetical protein